MARFLVTGGCGFIGSHLVEALCTSGNRVVVLDDLSSGTPDNLVPGADLEQGSVTDSELFSRLAEGTDGIFHLAAISSVEAAARDPEGSSATNLGGTLNALAAAGAHGIPLVLTSSAAVYGNAGSELVDESSPVHPRSQYGRDKRLGEEAALRAVRAGRSVTAVRPFNVYGPRQSPGSPYAGVISRFISDCLADRTLRIDGDGKQSRDFIYVTDLVRLLIAAQAENVERPPIVNGCTGRQTEIRALAQLIAELCVVHPRFENALARPDDIRHSCGAPDLAAVQLGFRAEVPLRSGLEATIAWQKTLRSAA